jgi:tetratricopeptide (TPR) repeat protein
VCRSTTRAAGLVLVAILVAWAPPPAAAQPESTEFDNLVADGGAKFEAKRYAAARAAWKRAYRLEPDPRLLFNIASTYRREGDRERALEHYRKYLAAAAEDAEYRSLAEEAILNIEQALDAERAARVTAVAPPPESPPASSNRRARILRYSGIGVAVGGAALLGVGVFRGLDARELDERLATLPDGTEWTPELQSDYERGQSLERQAIIFSVAGGSAIAIGAALYVAGVLDEDTPTEKPLALTPTLIGNRLGLTMAGRF